MRRSVCARPEPNCEERWPLARFAPCRQVRRRREGSRAGSSRSEATMAAAKRAAAKAVKPMRDGSSPWAAATAGSSSAARAESAKVSAMALRFAGGSMAAICIASRNAPPMKAAHSCAIGRARRGSHHRKRPMATAIPATVPISASASSVGYTASQAGPSRTTPMLATGRTSSATDPKELAAIEVSREARIRRTGSGEASRRSMPPRSCRVRAVPSSPCALIQARTQTIGTAPAGGPAPPLSSFNRTSHTTIGHARRCRTTMPARQTAQVAAGVRRPNMSRNRRQLSVRSCATSHGSDAGLSLMRPARPCP